MKKVTYPVTPDYSIKVGDRVRSFDFPGNATCYFVGVVDAITPLGQYDIKVEYQVWLDERVADKDNYCARVMPPLNGMEGIFGETCGVQRIVETETEGA